MMRFKIFRHVGLSRAEIRWKPTAGNGHAMRRLFHSSVQSIVPRNTPTRQQQKLEFSQHSIFTSSSSTAPEWHRPAFMEGSSIEEKEDWLESAIASDPRIDSTAYLVVLKDLAKSHQSGSPQRAEEWIRRLESKATSQPLSQHLWPTVECYNAVIQAWSNSREDPSVSVNRAERWLNKIRRKPVDDNRMTFAVANTDSYNAFLDACSKGRGGRRNGAIARKFAEKAQETLGSMIEENEALGTETCAIPNTESFNYVIRAWTRVRNWPPVARRVMELLKLMTEYQRRDPDSSPVLPNTQSYTMTMDAFAGAAGLRSSRVQMHGSPEDRQNPAKNGRQDVQMVEDLVEYMHKLHEEGGLDYVMPNTVTYNVLISAWARLAGPIHPAAPLEAEKVLRKMISLRDNYHPEVAPDALSYTKVMLAWTNLGRDTAGKRAQWWLEKLYEEYEVTNDERLRPSVAAYNAVIKAWARVGQPSNAEMLLIDLIRNEESQKVPLLKPNSESFSLVIHSLLKTKGGASNGGDIYEGCRRAATWLDELIRRESDGSYGVTTSPELFDCVLKAASKCEDVGPEMLDFSIAIFEKYRESRHRLDFKAYVWLLQIGLDTLGTQDVQLFRDLIQRLVKDCCDDGLLSNLFIRTLANGPVWYQGWTRAESARFVNECFPMWPLPWEWSRNVPSQEFLPRRDDSRRTNVETKMRSHG